jgi:hypothetical protein
MNDFNYREYIQSKEWKEKAKLVRRRARGLCEGCLTERATQVHHLTYDNLGNELLFELVALCGECHNRIHNQTFGPGAETFLDESNEERVIRSEWLFHLHGHLPLNADPTKSYEPPLVTESGPKWPELRPRFEVQAKIIIRTMDWLWVVAKKRGLPTINHVTQTIIREEVKIEQEEAEKVKTHFRPSSEI